MDYKLSEFATDDYKMLVELSKYQVKIKGVDTVPITQKEIAEECNLSYPTTNKLMAMLMDKGCIVAAQNKGRYIITPKGLACIAELEKVRSIDNEIDKKGD